jgi:hypothetical protein
MASHYLATFIKHLHSQTDGPSKDHCRICCKKKIKATVKLLMNEFNDHCFSSQRLLAQMLTTNIMLLLSLTTKQCNHAARLKEKKVVLYHRQAFVAQQILQRNCNFVILLAKKQCYHPWITIIAFQEIESRRATPHGSAQNNRV